MMKWIKNKNVKAMIIILLALFITIAFSLSLDIIEPDKVLQNEHYIVKIFSKFSNSINKDIFKSLLIFILSIIILKQTLFKEKIETKLQRICKIILAMLFSIFMVFGYSYMKTNSSNMIFLNKFQLTKAIIIGTGYYILFRAIINYLFDKAFINIQIKETTNKIYKFIFIKHSFIMPLIIILICWLPYIIFLYPGTLFHDSSNQIRQYFGYDVPENSSTNSAILIDENVKITNHHPVVHTVILGMCMQFGKLIGNDNIRSLYLYNFTSWIISFYIIIYYTFYEKIENSKLVTNIIFIVFCNRANYSNICT